MDKKVTIYSTPTCHFCALAKKFFKENSISFTDYNVASDIEKRKEMLEISGQMGVPVIVIGESVVIGFNKPIIEAELSCLSRVRGSVVKVRGGGVVL